LLARTAGAPAAAAASLAVAAVGVPVSCAVAEALVSAARIKAKAVLAKMRSKRGPFIRALSQKFLRTRLTCGALRLRSTCAIRVRTRRGFAHRGNSRADNCGRIWSDCGRIGSILVRCHPPTTGEPIFFSTTVTLQRRRFRTRDFRIACERIQLAVKRRASDVQPPRDLGHLTAVMADGESDGLGFDVGKRAHMTAFVEQCQGGLVAEAAHALVEEALHSIVVDHQTAFAHAATPRPNVCRIGALSPTRLNAALKVPRWPQPLRASYS